jgi:Ca-activated chloride channel family protein
LERPVTIFGKYRGKARGKITLTGLSGEGRYSETIDVAKVQPMDGNGALRYLWARHRITLLSDYNKLRSDDGRTREVTDLGLRYNLLTAYTSFVAIDTEIRAKDGKPVSVKQPLPLPQGVSDYAMGGILASGGSLPALAYAPSPGMSMGGGYGPRAIARMPKALAYDVRVTAPPGSSEENAREQAVQVQTGKGKGAAKRMITVGEIAVSGGLSKEAVSRVVRARAQALGKYYRGSGSVAQLVVRLTIGRDGTVRAVKVLRGAVDNKRGIADQIQKWRFPATGDGKEASATITLLVGA